MWSPGTIQRRSSVPLEQATGIVRPVGTWGVGVLQGDLAADVHGEYLGQYDAGKTAEEIVALLKASHSVAFGDADEAGVVWLAIAKAQWECGAVMSEVRAAVDRIVRTGEGLALWGGSAVRRQNALDGFLAKLGTVNPRPRKRRKPIVRKPIFDAGDCLSIRLSDGDFGAAIVLASPAEQARPGGATLGVNLIGVLRHKSPHPPTAGVFEERDWLRLTFGAWRGELQVFNVAALGFRAQKHRYSVLCKTPIRPEDPQESHSYSGWHFDELAVLQWASEKGPALATLVERVSDANHHPPEDDDAPRGREHW
jgi:hypothetical protein